MSKPFEPIDFADTADLVRFDLTEISESDWNECQEARYRTAASRAYYGVFLALKIRIEPARIGFKFPTKEVHSKLRTALVSELGASHPLVIILQSLLSNRKAADYDEGRTFGMTVAQSMADSSHTALTHVDGLTLKQLRSIADALFDQDSSGFR